jgi:hypothetical protein
MPVVSEAVKAERLAKAKDWLADDTIELQYSTASGYYVPPAFRSTPANKITDDFVQLLMKAQGYKRRAKKDGATGTGSESDTSSDKKKPKSPEQVIDIGTQPLTWEEPQGSTLERILEILEKWDTFGLRTTI